MAPAPDNIRINAIVEIPASSLQTIVSTAKKMVSPDEKGIYNLDTADMVNQLITAFLLEKGFDEFVSNCDNYKKKYVEKENEVFFIY